MMNSLRFPELDASLLANSVATGIHETPRFLEPCLLLDEWRTDVAIDALLERLGNGVGPPGTMKTGA